MKTTATFLAAIACCATCSVRAGYSVGDQGDRGVTPSEIFGGLDKSE